VISKHSLFVRGFSPISTVSHRNDPHGREVQKLLHRSCISPVKYACRCTGISHCFLALPARAAEKVLVYSHNLYCPRFALEDNQNPTRDLQVKKALETSAGPKLRDWWFSYIDYALYSILPDNLKEAAAIKRKTPRFHYNAITRTLYHRSHDGILLHCLSHEEAHEALKEAHDGMCGAHQPGLKLGDRLWRLGYYWPKMIPDAIAYAKWCHACQIHGDFIHQAPGHLRPTTSSWLFEMWGMDVVGPIIPPLSKGHWFILAIIEYFSKWPEVPLKKVKTSDVIKFVKHHVVYCFGMPWRIIHDNGPQFVS